MRWTMNEYNHDARTQSPRLTAARLQLAVGRRGLGPREQGDQRTQRASFVATYHARVHTEQQQLPCWARVRWTMNEYNHDARTQSPRLTTARLQLAVSRRGPGPREQGNQRTQRASFVATYHARVHTEQQQLPCWARVLVPREARRHVSSRPKRRVAAYRC